MIISSFLATCCSAASWPGNFVFMMWKLRASLFFNILPQTLHKTPSLLSCISTVTKCFSSSLKTDGNFRRRFKSGDIRKASLIWWFSTSCDVCSWCFEIKAGCCWSHGASSQSLRRLSISKTSRFGGVSDTWRSSMWSVWVEWTESAANKIQYDVLIIH